MPSTTMKLSPAAAERARKNESMVLQRLASVGQAAVADAAGVSESTVSRFKDGELERICAVLSVLGLKVVPIEMKCYPSDQIDAIFTLAKARMKNLDHADKLACEE